MRSVVAVVVAPVSVGVTSAKATDEARLMPTKVARGVMLVSFWTAGASSDCAIAAVSPATAWASQGSEGNSIRPSTRTTAQLLIIPAMPSCGIRLSLPRLNLFPCILNTATSYFLVLRCYDKKRHRIGCLYQTTNRGQSRSFCRCGAVFTTPHKYCGLE